MNGGIRDEERAAIDQALRELPPIEPPPALVARTLRAVGEADARRRRTRRIGAMMLVLAVVVLTAGLALMAKGVRYEAMSPSLSQNLPADPGPVSNAGERTSVVVDDRVAGFDEAAQGGQAAPEGNKPAEPRREASESARTETLVDGQDRDRGLVDAERAAALDGKKGVKGEDFFAAKVDKVTGQVDRDGEPVAAVDAPVDASKDHFWRGPTTGESDADERGRAPEGRDHGGYLYKEGWTDSTRWVEPLAGDVPPVALRTTRDQEVTLEAGAFEIATGKEVVSRIDAREQPAAAAPATPAQTQTNPLDLGSLRDTNGLAQDVGNGDATTTLVAPDESLLANGESAANQRTPLAFIPARGYFTNTYVPGDGPSVRLDLTRVKDKLGGEVPDVVHAVTQPFDRPVGQALALQLAADRTAVEGPTRLTLQVGIAGAAPVKTRRAPLALALVVDVASVADEAERRTLWRLADALVAERQPGDAFAIIVPRAAGPEVLAGEHLTAPEVARALGAAAEERAALDAAAVGAAYAAVRGARPATSEVATKKAMTLGASTVVVATARTFDAGLASALAERAHREALGDVQLSLVGTGSGADRGMLGALAQRGQGRRWLASSADDAARVVQSELASAGRTVARAVRLRIRLAPGVQLVSVIGAEPLALVDTARTREAEAAIDRRLADMTGIAADRGADEDGIQIVIPAFMAGDDHAILLDVVVPGPGPVLDVRARWKDLLRMDNAEAQASLTLPSGVDQATPLALNVVENRAAMVASRALEDAARLLAAGDPLAAQPRLSIARGELDLLARRAPGVRDEVDLVARYQALLQQAPAWMQDDAARDDVMRALEDSWRTLR